MYKSLENLEKEDGRIRSLLNQTKVRVEDVAKDSRIFSDTEIRSIKDVVNVKWEILSKKVSTLAEEVFEEVMEHELALCQLE